MKVFLIKTPGYEIENFYEVHELLKSQEEPLQFTKTDFEFSPEQFAFLQNDLKGFGGNKSNTKRNYPDEEKAKPLDWSELFSLCNFYRSNFNIATADFVILLTKRRNNRNFFSMFDDKCNNAFVQTSGWEEFINAPQKYPITYEVVANILRSLMKLPHSFPNRLFHHLAIGCTNDYCEKKSEIILKLRTADICKDCLARMRDERVDDEIINQALTIFEEIRKQLLFKQGFTKNVAPKEVKVDGMGKILVGEKEIKLDPIKKTLFIFFLKYNQGISLFELKNYKNELIFIYQKIRPGGSTTPIDALVKRYLQPKGTFSKNKTQLNLELKKQIREPLSPFYYIDGNPGGAFKIALDPSLITLDPSFN